MAGIKWTDKEDSLLADLWPTAPKEKIVESFDRTYASLIIRASSLGIKKKYDKHPYVKTNLEALLENTCSAFYWIGFLMADGCIQKNRLKLTLAKKDRDHLLAFKDFCKIPNYFTTKKTIGVQAQDSFDIPKICSKFNMRERKTYRPTIFIPKQQDLLIAYLIGFIDGDGCIRKQSGRKDSTIAIKLHRSWLNYLNKLSSKISGIVGVKPTRARINKKGYAIINLCNSLILKYLKRKINELNLPALKRKWDRIDLNYVSVHEKSIEAKKKLVKLVGKGLRNREIAGIVEMSEAWVSINKRRIA